MIYCIDTHTFIWAVKKQAEAHDNHRLEEGKAFRKWLKDCKHQAMVPSMVIAEALIKENEEDHSKILNESFKSFMVVGFDERCALKYGELLRLERWEIAKFEQRSNDIRREKMKIDHMILCCALVNGAHGLFTEDPDFIRFAKPHIKILSTSSIGIQQDITFEQKKK